MTLTKIVQGKSAEGASLKDIKHVIKRHKEGKALNVWNRYAEELTIQKLFSSGKSAADVLAVIADKANHFELKWNDKRLAKLAEKATKIASIAKAKADKKAAKDAKIAERNSKREAKVKAKAEAKLAKEAAKAAKAAATPAPTAAPIVKRRKVKAAETPPIAIAISEAPKA